MKYAWLVLAIFAARFLTTAIVYPPSDGDLYWQRLLGAQVLRDRAVPRFLGAEAFSAPHAPWVPQEWLFGIAAYLGRSGVAWDLFAGGVALGAIAALGIACLHAARRGASPAAVAICATLAGLAMFESFGVRAQVAVWPLLAAFMLLLDIDGPWAYAAAAVAMVWSNWHASAMLAPIVAAIYAAGSTLDERGFGTRSRRTATIAALCVAAICCNPLGWDLPRYALGWFGNPTTAYISEWKVPDFDDAAFMVGALPLLLLAIVFGGRGISRATSDWYWRNLLILGTFTFLLLSAARNVAVFSIVALPIVSTALSQWLERQPESRRAGLARAAAYVLPLGAFFVAIFVCVRLTLAAPPNTNLANAPLAAVAKMPGERAIFCADFAWCSLALGVPNERVFLDGRADPYPPPVWQEMSAITGLEPGWRQVLDRRGINTIVAGRYSPLDQALGLTRGWRLAYVDASYVLYVRTAAAPRPN